MMQPGHRVRVTQRLSECFTRETVGVTRGMTHDSLTGVLSLLIEIAPGHTRHIRTDIPYTVTFA